MTLADFDIVSLFEKVRPSFFSGFLTITGFLFTAHTFMVTHMKKEIYEQGWYRTRIDGLRDVNPSHSYFGALRRFSTLLLYTLRLSLVTAILQVTCGLISSSLAAWICVVFAGSTVFLLAACVYVLSGNMQDWFDEVEKMEVERWTAAREAERRAAENTGSQRHEST